MPSATISKPWGHGSGLVTGAAEADLTYRTDASVEPSDGRDMRGPVDSDRPLD